MITAGAAILPARLAAAPSTKPLSASWLERVGTANSLMSSSSGCGCEYYLYYSQEGQECDNWCWAACSVSIANYMCCSWSQCDLVSATFSMDCCDMRACTNDCNQGCWPDGPLTTVGCYRTVSSGGLSMSQIMDEICNWQPISIVIAWSGGGSHNVVIAGYDNCNPSSPTIDIEDPWYGSSTQNYNSFPSTYHGGASWYNSYLTAWPGCC